LKLLNFTTDVSTYARTLRSFSTGCIWNTAEFSVYADLTDDTELAKLCELLNQECGLRDLWNLVTKMLNEVAKILGTFDWSDSVKTTSDFVVFANDIEGSDLRQNFNFSVPSNLLKQFKKADWLPYW
jgi:hypothetical protein